MVENNPVVKLPIPDSVKVMAWALAAGLVGHPISIQLLGISGYLKTHICRTMMQWVGEPYCKIISSKKDIKQVLANIGWFNFAIFTDLNLFSYAEWQFENTFDKNARNRRAGPVFLLLGTEAPDESAGPLLRMHCAPLEIRVIQNWLKSGPVLPIFPQLDPKSVVSLDLRNDALNGWADPDQSGADLLILGSLLLGASLIEKNALANQTRVIDQETYVTVKAALKSRIFQPPGCNYLSRLSFMVHRANKYLQMRHTDKLDRNNTEKCDPDAIQTKKFITTREMVDLGNPGGKTLRDLVDYLRKDPKNGLKHFISFGLTTKLTGDTWPSTDSEACSKYLIPWTPKQVRTEFSKAINSNFLTAVRSAGNQPFLYELPESFKQPSLAFRSLPEPDALIFPLGSIEPPAPASPSPAYSSGQMEVVFL